MPIIRPRRLRDTDLAAAIDSHDPKIADLARVVTHAGVRCVDLEQLVSSGTLDPGTARERVDALHVAQAALSFHQAALLALVVAQEGA